MRIAAKKTRAILAVISRVRGKTDGCTMSPDLNFIECCIEHDLNYRGDGDSVSRSEADKRLRICITSRGHGIVAWVYWAAVRVFGRTSWKGKK